MNPIVENGFDLITLNDMITKKITMTLSVNLGVTEAR